MSTRPPADPALRFRAVYETIPGLMRSRLIKSVTFEAAHFLPAFPEGHKCRRMHGHSFKADLICAGEVTDGQPWLIDFSEIKQAFAPLYDQLDHRLLNDVPGLENPSAEILSAWIFKQLKPRLPLLIGVRVQETCTGAAEYWEADQAEGSASSPG